MSENEFVNMIHRYLTGDCTPAQAAQVEKWINSSPKNRKMFETLKKIWEVEPEQELRANIITAWRELEQKMDEQQQAGTRHLQGEHSVRRSGYPSLNRPGHTQAQRTAQKHNRIGGNVWFRAVAFLMVAVLISLFAVWFTGSGLFTNEDSMVMEEIRTERAQHSKVAFSDGTEVRLNASSSLRYPAQFDRDVREVYLEGEAWFDVKSQSDLEFIVHTPDAVIRVLGTEFNVKAYSEEAEVEVAVGDGIVSVHATGGNPLDSAGVRLEKNEMSRVIRGEVPTPALQVNIERYTSWLRGDFVFVETPFFKVLADWERQFNVDFNIESDELKNTPLTGEFKDESFEEMLRLTSMALDFGYKHDGGTITITK